MPVETIILYGIGVVLFIAALVVSFFVFSDVATLLRDIARHRRSADEMSGDSGLPERRIKPFRDRSTIERLIAYFGGKRE